MKLAPKQIEKFSAWLANAGAEILAPTNEWEVLRFKARGKVNVVYKNAKGVLNFTNCNAEAIKAFSNGEGWQAGLNVTRKKRRPAQVLALLRRDGDNCFLCGFPLEDDITLEHLVPLAHGGPNHMSNYALVHDRCNLLLGAKSLMEKIKLREHHQNWSVTQ